MQKEHILHHYRKEEVPFVEKVIDWANKASITHQTIRTDFIDPRQLIIIQSIINGYMDLKLFYDGGYVDAERVRVLIAPDYYIQQADDMGLAFFRVKGENKFEALQHRDYLGALLNIGLKREKFGDILLSDSNNQLIIAEEVADYVEMKFSKIGHTKVQLERINQDLLCPPDQRLEQVIVTTTSLRVDAIVSQLYHQSRAKVVEWIKRGYLKVNWQVIERIDYTLKKGDVVSFRGFGRFTFLDEEGITKKERIRLKIGKLL